MSVASLTLVALLLAAENSEAPAEKSQADKESAERVLALARQYQFYGDREQRTKFELQGKPLLMYSNPIRGEVYGNVFVWTHAGRPEVIGAVFDFRSEDKFDSELHTLARGGIVGFRDNKEFWNPKAPGVIFAPVPHAPAPGATPAARLREMRAIVREFVVEREHPEQGRGAMRLLTQPIYRYASPEQGVTDGALFAFVEGTDPEAYLLLEATSNPPRWQFALARMNVVEFRATYRDEPVWHVGEVSWDTVFDRQEPYAIIRENPRRGLVRTP